MSEYVDDPRLSDAANAKWREITESDRAGFRIGDAVYEMASVRRVTLRDSLQFNAEARRENLGITWAGLLALVDEVSALPVAERVAHEGTWLLMAAVIWSSRRAQGEDVSFLDAIDVPLEDIAWFNEDDPRLSDAATRGYGEHIRGDVFRSFEERTWAFVVFAKDHELHSVVAGDNCYRSQAEAFAACEFTVAAAREAWMRGKGRRRLAQ